MINRFPRQFVRSLGLLSAALGLLLVTGCAEMITFSQRSNQKGMELFRTGEYVDAAGAFRDSIKQDPRNYESQYFLGVCYDRTQQHHLAFQQFLTTLDVMGQTAEGRKDDAFRAQVIDTLAAAVVRYDTPGVELTQLESRAQQSNSADDWLVVAKIHRLKGDADSALVAYKRADMWGPESFAVSKDYGLYLLEIGQKKEAERVLQKAYDLDRTGDPAVKEGLAKLGVNVPNYRPAAPAVGSTVSPRD